MVNPAFEETKQNYIKVDKLRKRKLIPHTSSKYYFLAPSVKRQSEQYLYEAENPKRKYWTFERGAMVFVEFGVNVGGELSNNHWAIILDKTDSPYKKTLTVLPLTSKKGKQTIPLKESVGEQSFDYLEERLKTLTEKIKSKKICEDEAKAQAEQLNEVIDYYSNYLKQSYIKCDSLQTISKDRILKKNPLDPVGKIKVSPSTLDAINKKMQELFF